MTNTENNDFMDIACYFAEKNASFGFLNIDFNLSRTVSVNIKGFKVTFSHFLCIM